MTYFFFRRLFKSSVDDDDNDDGVQVGGGEDEQLPGECGVARAGQETWQTGSHTPGHAQEAGTV